MASNIPMIESIIACKKVSAISPKICRVPSLAIATGVAIQEKATKAEVMAIILVSHIAMKMLEHASTINDKVLNTRTSGFLSFRFIRGAAHNILFGSNG